MRDIESFSKKAISNHDNYLEGFFAGVKSKNYFLGVNYASAVTGINFSHKGSDLLDKINAFDLAEIAEANIGQVNMIQVSSFCGPDGLIWGYDVCQTKKEKDAWSIEYVADKKGKDIPVYDAAPLRKAFKSLTGSVGNPRFPFRPASHVPCAAKYINICGPAIIYVGVGLGIPKNRDKNACLIMEDMGMIPLQEKDNQNYRKMITENLVKSVVQIGDNQRVDFKEIFVGMSESHIQKKQVGCSLVAMPYFVLAKKAYPKNKQISQIKFNEWKQLMEKN